VKARSADVLSASNGERIKGEVSIFAVWLSKASNPVAAKRCEDGSKATADLSNIASATVEER
jgi:hypothetical protein